MATALDLYIPFDSGAGANVTEDNWRKMALHWKASGPIRQEDNELEAYGDDSGMQVKVKTGKVWIRGEYGEVTSEKTLPVTANATGSTRIDRVVARLDVVNNVIELDVVAGTVAAPALVQSASIWEISLATISVTNGDVSIAANQVTDGRIFASTPGVTNKRTSQIIPTGTRTITDAAGIVDAPGGADGAVTVQFVKRYAWTRLIIGYTVYGQMGVANQFLDVYADIDGVDTQIGKHQQGPANTAFGVTAVKEVTGIAAGAHTIKLQVNTTGATLTMTGSDTLTLSVEEAYG